MRAQEIKTKAKEKERKTGERGDPEKKRQ